MTSSIFLLTVCSDSGMLNNNPVRSVFVGDNNYSINEKIDYFVDDGNRLYLDGNINFNLVSDYNIGVTPRIAPWFYISSEAYELIS